MLEKYPNTINILKERKNKLIESIKNSIDNNNENILNKIFNIDMKLKGYNDYIKKIDIDKPNKVSPNENIIKERLVDINNKFNENIKNKTKKDKEKIKTKKNNNQKNKYIL